MKNNIDELKLLIERAKAEVSVFKANGRNFINHSFEFNSTITSDDLKALDLKYGVCLPEDYCEYLMKIGNGGNQPGCGMFSVQETLAIVSNETFGESVLATSDLASSYCRKFHYDVQLKNYETATNMTLDDYFDYETLQSSFQHYLIEDRVDEFDAIEKEMKKHMLIFGFYDEIHVEYAIALDGKYKGKVVYYTYEAPKNIKITNLSFLEWMIEYYKNGLECRPGYFLSV